MNSGDLSIISIMICGKLSALFGAGEPALKRSEYICTAGPTYTPLTLRPLCSSLQILTEQSHPQLRR